jgi:hypothetical protein
MPPDRPLNDAPTLVAIAKAAHQIGNRSLELAARQLLREQHGIELSFPRAFHANLSQNSAGQKGGNHAP